MRILAVRLAASAAAVLSLGACCCGVSEPSGPLTGEWTYDLLDVRADEMDPVGCSFTGIALRLEQRGERLTGNAAGGFGQCVRDDGTPIPAVPLQPASIEGTVTGTRVVFEIGDFLANDGTLAGNQVSGTAVFTASAEGTFTLRRR